MTPQIESREEIARAKAAEGFRRERDALRQELWDCYCATGADPDGADARHLNPGEALRAVKEFRNDSDEASGAEPTFPEVA